MNKKKTLHLYLGHKFSRQFNLQIKPNYKHILLECKKYPNVQLSIRFALALVKTPIDIVTAHKFVSMYTLYIYYTIYTSDEPA